MISMDKKYRTRDGRDVRLLCVDGDAGQPVVGIVSGRVDQWNGDGSWTVKHETKNDLIEYHEPDIRTIWVNVYEGSLTTHESESDARANCCAPLAIAIAQPVTFEVKK